jgi:hypothetical protein
MKLEARLDPAAAFQKDLIPDLDDAIKISRSERSAIRQSRFRRHLYFLSLAHVVAPEGEICSCE